LKWLVGIGCICAPTNFCQKPITAIICNTRYSLIIEEMRVAPHYYYLGTLLIIVLIALQYTGKNKE